LVPLIATIPHSAFILLDMSSDPTDTTSATTNTTTTPTVTNKNAPLTDYSVIVPNLTGFVKWFNNKSGFGFITVLADGDYKDKDIFVHYTSILVANQQYKYLVQGEYVDFMLVKANSDTHEFQAMNVSGVKGGPIMCEIRRTTQVDPAHRPPRREAPSQPRNEGDEQRPRRVGRRPQSAVGGPGRRPPRGEGSATAPAPASAEGGDDMMGFTKVEKKSYRSAVARARK
jgi:cold shock CspA family protein